MKQYADISYEMYIRVWLWQCVGKTACSVHKFHTSYDDIEWYTMEFPPSHLYFPDIDKCLLAIQKLQNWFRAPKAQIMRMRLAISWDPCAVMTR